MSSAENERDRVLRLGREALANLNTSKNWHWWVDVGVALHIGREECKEQVGLKNSNVPPNKYGARYNRVFSHWMQEQGFNTIDAGDRSRLLQVMDNLDKITAWRDTLTEPERRNLNHPSSVYRQWKRKTEPKPRPEVRKSATATERDRVEKLLGMLGSDQNGEQAAAATAILNVAKTRKQTIVELMRSVFARA